MAARLVPFPAHRTVRERHRAFHRFTQDFGPLSIAEMDLVKAYRVFCGDTREWFLRWVMTMEETERARRQEQAQGRRAPKRGPVA